MKMINNDDDDDTTFDVVATIQAETTQGKQNVAQEMFFIVFIDMFHIKKFFIELFFLF